MQEIKNILEQLRKMKTQVIIILLFAFILFYYKALITEVVEKKVSTVDEVKKDTLVLRHEHDGRDLELDYADNCVRKIKDLWKGPVQLFTILENEPFEIS